MDNETENGAASAPHDRGELVRDIAVLQVKLVFDGLRDLVLVPVSLVAGVISLLRAGDPSGNEFYALLRLGRRSERWINLFGAADRLPAPDREHYPEGDIDALVGRVESLVVEEYRRGGVTKQAKDHLDQLVRSLRRHREPPAD
ncbi:MAG: hypothetical protein OEV41_03865 [Gammaproteobacteria bacterium]|nr:hypothetical protein [Gammaproteobacteria bacterium]MDH5344688.1 hypothetical protein [Gammaproteobacteria bacterium]